MTKTEVIKALKQLGGIGTRKQIEDIVGANQHYVISRMRKWNELETMFSDDTIGGEYIYILNESTDIQ